MDIYVYVEATILLLVHKSHIFWTLPWIYTSYNSALCSGQKKPESWGRHSEALDNLGSGNLEGGEIGERVGKGEVSLQATWDQGGRILLQLGGFQVSERDSKGEQKGLQQGEIKSKGIAPCIL